MCLLVDNYWDEDGDPYGKAEGDPNFYTTGRIGKCDVVLVYLPNMGKASAANAASSLRSSYPRVSLALVVGVCGAVPFIGPKRDQVVLGDVIISKLVVQYNLGKVLPDRFARKDTDHDRLGRPNKILRNMLATLDTDLHIQRLEQRAGKLLNHLLKKNAERRNRGRRTRYTSYQYPGVANDRLFLANYRHKHAPSHGCKTCDACHKSTDPVCEMSLQRPCEELGCDWSYQVSREGQMFSGPSESDPVKCFLGEIGSGDGVIRSGEHRDQIAKEAGVIAFEMEGAGVWDELPCIVIKGVSDYADSHKSKAWQSYAAATAASVARAVLEKFINTAKVSFSGSLQSVGTAHGDRTSRGTAYYNTNIASSEQRITMPESVYNTACGGGESVSGPQADNGSNINMVSNYAQVTANNPTNNPALRPPFSNVPYRSDPHHVDRPKIMEWLRKRLCPPPTSRHSRAALFGLGGIGKSKLAIRYAEEFRGKLPQAYVFWVTAGSKESFVQGFRRIAEDLRLPVPSSSGNDMLRRVRSWLCDNENVQWLIILDNADDYRVFRDQRTTSDVLPAIDSEALETFLPQTNNGRILITSRSQQTAEILALSHEDTCSVPEMDEDQARLLFSNKLGDCGESEDIARKVVLALNCIPLCISQAAAYIHKLRPRMTCAKYLEKFNGRNLVALSSRDSIDRYNLDAKNCEVENKTWQVTFNQIRDERQSAAGLLALMSSFQPQGIPGWVLQKHYSEMDNDDSSIDLSHNGEDEFENDLILLRDYSLVAVAQDGKSFQMHGLVQSFTRSWLEASHEDHKWRRCFWRLMIKTYPEAEPANWRVCGELTPHVEPLVNTTGRQLEDSDETICFVELLRKVGGYNHATAMYETALKIISKAEQLATQRLGQHHEQVYRILTTKAIILVNSGSAAVVAAAEEIALGAYRGLTSLLGLDNPTTRCVGEIYARSLVATGKLDEAQAIYAEMLESQKGISSPNIVVSSATLNGLGNIAYAKGNCNEAEELYRLAYQSDCDTHGLTSPLTLVSLYYVAVVLTAQEKWAEAEPKINEVVERTNEILGPEHPDTLLACKLQASSLVHQKRFEEAEKIRRRVLEAQKKILGLEHPTTIRTLRGYGDVLAFQHKWGEAEGICRQLVETQERVLGPEHRDTLGSLCKLARILAKFGRGAKARSIFRQVWELRKGTLGPEHPDTLDSLKWVGYLSVKLGKFEEAAEILHQVLELQKRVLGPEHPKILDTLSRLGFVTSRLPRDEEAERVYYERWQLAQRIHGPTHPVSLKYHLRLGSWFESRARYGEAEETFRQVIELEKQASPPRNGKVLETMTTIARILRKQDKDEEARKVEDEWNI
ncbi:uncharacterized protein B0T23DRAFT_398002 [Neurospora hispaniola]|uniref:DUF7779 domain-containing protein n=1 Tax=Neurospora hispaniola TaxID=588809 RepID=A0AAJ0MQ17_9PEZI|nr:hypothetical protein B0T23DRAFT_398002 [Neurospora hispaniola]